MKKEILVIAATGIVLVVLLIHFGIYGGNAQVNFTAVDGDGLPRELETEILPAYRELERALACRIEDEIYVLAMRGEKPTSGYEIQITKLELVSKNGTNHLLVYADFADPKRPENMAQVASFPVSVVKAELSGLPDTIELCATYVKE